LRRITVRNLMLIGLSLVLVLGGCGKKGDNHNKSKEVTKKKRGWFAQADDAKKVPVYTAENEELLKDDEALADFAFVDENDAYSEDAKEVAQADLDAVADELIASTRELDDAIKALDESLDSDNEEQGLVIEADDLLASADDQADDEDRNMIYESDFETVQFAFNGDAISKDQKVSIDKDSELAKKATEQGQTVIVKGHTCQMGSAVYNLALSQKRAEKVKTEMVARGVSEDNIKTLGMGFESPLVWTDETERNAKIRDLSPNRRAEIELDSAPSA